MEERKQQDEEEEDEELPLLPGQRKKRKVRLPFFFSLLFLYRVGHRSGLLSCGLPYSDLRFSFFKNASAAEARDSEFLAQLDKQLAEASQMLGEHFTEAQQDRYEAYRRSFLKDASMRKTIQSVTDKAVGKPALSAIKGERTTSLVFFC